MILSLICDPNASGDAYRNEREPHSRPTSDDLWTQAATSLSKKDQANLDFQRSDKLEILSDLLSLTEKEIQRCEKLGDVAVQYDPVHASLPWAGIRFLLEVTVSDFNAAELILEHATSLAEMIPRYTIFEQIFLQSTSGAAPELERGLTVLYAKMLLYLAKAKAQFQHGTLKRSVKNVLLITPDFENHFQGILGAQITVDRCAAIVGREKYGNSKLVSAVIEDTLQSSQTGQSPLPVYFYCSRNPAEPSRSIPSEVIASIARQLARTSPTGPLLQPAIARYEEQEVQGFAAERLTLGESQSLIIDLLALHPVASIIIDALDECDPDTRAEILDMFTNIFHNSSTLVKLFISSRDDQDILY
ncbi:hypothetical protein BJX68DRAFT_267999 [Aspergillus pseudodeflectus]|uniref:Nephrocystin 3-like N-terminal domain-containing protein n=1 Tax=Aspergillus pseudodeflectus TaxID=176178 RepID=A0ABR4K5L3_9EURO